MMMPNVYPQFQDGFQPEDLVNLPARVLFYPCSCKDFVEPVKLFTPWIHTFWFVDVGYFFDRPPEYTPPVFTHHPDFQFIDQKISIADLPEEDWMTDSKYRGIPPYILSERYTH